MISSVDIQGNEVDNTVPSTNVNIRWNEEETTFSQSINVLASLNVSVGNCYNEVYSLCLCERRKSVLS